MAVYRPKYQDKKTGEKRQQAVWWYDFNFAGQRYNKSTGQTLKTLAVEFEKNERRRIERAFAGRRAERPSQRIRTISEALKAHQQGYENRAP
jgi:hypothetical protein